MVRRFGRSVNRNVGRAPAKQSAQAYLAPEIDFLPIHTDDFVLPQQAPIFPSTTRTVGG